MSAPITTLADILTMVHNQYGIRFQANTEELVRYANMIQYIVYNQDLSCFVEDEQTFVLGQDVFMDTDTSYIAPTDSDIGKTVVGNTVGSIGKLMNYQTKNRSNKWIIEPPDGGTEITLPDDEILTLAGSTGTGVVCDGQPFNVSTGPYRMPTAAAGNPPYRKLIGVSTLTDEERFRVPNNSGYDGIDDYGIALNETGGRYKNTPYILNKVNQHMEITLVLTTAPQIIQTEEACGPGGITLNTSSYRWSYYTNPPPIENKADEDNLVIPEEYRYEVFFKGISRLADTGTFGDMGSVRDLIAPLCERFWEDMRTQEQAYGRSSSWISHGDQWTGNAFDEYYNQTQYNNSQFRG